MADNQLLILALASIIPLYYISKSLLNKSQIPHVSGGNWITGYTDTLLSNPVSLMKECREKYGSLYSINHLGKKVIIFGKEWIDELFKNKEVLFEEALNEAFLIVETVGSQKYIHSPKANSGRIVRSMITPYLKAYNTRIYDQINRVEKEIFEGKSSVLSNTPAEIMRRMVVKASSNIMFGDRFSEDDEIIDAFYKYPLTVEFATFSKMKYLKYPIIGRWYARYLLNKEKAHLPYQNLFFDKITKEKAIRKKEEQTEGYQKPNDLLQRMLDDGFTVDEISVSSLALVFASIMTTTNTSTLALYDMVTYPQYFNELYEEQLQIQKEHGDELNPEIIAKMIKLNSFIRESMRLRNGGINNFRITKADWTLSNGITIPKGSFIGVDVFSLHFDNELQDGSPYEFTPFRHAANGKLATKVEPQNVSFGLGQHACPGRFLAIQEISTILSIVIRNYKVSTQDEKPHPYMVLPAMFDLPKGEPLLFTKINF